MSRLLQTRAKPKRTTTRRITITITTKDYFRRRTWYNQKRITCAHLPREKTIDPTDAGNMQTALATLVATYGPCTATDRIQETPANVIKTVAFMDTAADGREDEEKK